jgi:hypothetical protein
MPSQLVSFDIHYSNSTRPLVQMSTRNIRGVKKAGAWGWQPHQLHVPNVMKSGNLKLLEPSGPHRACYGNPLVKVKQSRNRPGVAQRVPVGLGSQISWHSAREGGEFVSPTHRPPLPPSMFLVLIFTRSSVDSRAMVPSEGNMSLKKSSDTTGNGSRDRPTSSAAP